MARAGGSPVKFDDWSVEEAAKLLMAAHEVIAGWAVSDAMRG
jgi:hypothetical protein